jgi:hypothetical protein
MSRFLPFLVSCILTCPAGAESTLRFGTAEIDPGARAEVPIMVRTESAIHAFSLVFFYNGRALTLEEFRINEAFVSRSSVRYTAINDHPEENYAIIGVVLVWDAPCVGCGFPATPADEERCLGWVVLGTREDTQPATYSLQPQNWLGDPRIANTFSIEGGRSVLPSLRAGSAVVRNHNVLRVRSTVVEPLSPASVVIEADHRVPLGGVQVSLTFDNTLARLRPDVPSSSDPCVRSISPCGLGLEKLLAPYAIEQFVLNVDNAYAPTMGWATCGMVFDYVPPYHDQVLPPAAEQALLTAHFELLPAAVHGTSVAVHLNDEVGTPPVVNKVLLPIYGTDGTIAELANITPIEEDGFIAVVAKPRPFRRGFINGDGRFNIADAVAILGFLFAGGQITCLSAADTNDDGKVNIADAIYFLAYLFTPGARPLPDPSYDCGYDPTPDALSCFTSSPGCD